MKRLSLRNQIVLLFGVLLLLLTSLGISFSVYTLTRKAKLERSAAITVGKEQLVTAASQVSRIYNDELNRALNVSRQFAQMIQVNTQGSSASLTRNQVNAMLKRVLETNPQLLGIYTDWEPDAFDGQDQANIGQPDADKAGRFVPWWARSGNEITLQANDFYYEDEITEDYYRLPMETRQDVLLEPYIDDVDGTPIMMTSLIVPMFTPERYLGMTGVDIALTDLQSGLDTYAASLYGADIVFSRPPEMRIDPDIEQAIKANVEASGGSYRVTDKMEDACENADIVYAKNYVALDLLPPVTQKPEQDEMVKLFAKYKGWIADEKRMNMAKPTAQYMHCLPCERGAEVSDAVLDGKWGTACYNEAENRLHAQKGVMACIIP